MERDSLEVVLLVIGVDSFVKEEFQLPLSPSSKEIHSGVGTA
jgi:hypothetical protein